MSPHWWLQPRSMACWAAPLPPGTLAALFISTNMTVESGTSHWAGAFWGGLGELFWLPLCLKALSTSLVLYGLPQGCSREYLAPFCLPHWSPSTSWVIFKFEYINILSCCCEAAWVSRVSRVPYRNTQDSSTTGPRFISSTCPWGWIFKHLYGFALPQCRIIGLRSCVTFSCLALSPNN